MTISGYAPLCAKLAGQRRLFSFENNLRCQRPHSDTDAQGAGTDPEFVLICFFFLSLKFLSGKMIRVHFGRPNAEKLSTSQIIRFDHQGSTESNARLLPERIDLSKIETPTSQKKNISIGIDE